jgi:signal transduction histidine kinase
MEIDSDKPGTRRKLSVEAEQTLEAIRAGQIDALVVRQNDFEKVYALRAFAEIERTETALKRAGLERKRTLVQLRALAEERERLFQDMHDGCIQSIYAVGLNLEASLRLIEVNPKEARQIVADSTASLNLVIQELRSFITGRKLQIGAGRDLRTEIQKAVQAAGNRGVTFTVDIDELAMRELSSEQALHLLHIAREAISNTTRHSNARTGRVSLTKRRGKVCLEVSDDGKGFVAEQLNHLGLGLHHIDARARKMGGSARISSVPNQGTRIVVDLGKAR